MDRSLTHPRPPAGADVLQRLRALRRPRDPRSRGRVAYPAIAGILFIAAWEAGSRGGLLNTDFFSSPSAIADAAVTILPTSAFWYDARVSASEFIIGYALAVAIAVPFGIVTGWVRPLQYFFAPWLNALNATPRIALLPLVILWFGLGLSSKVALVFLAVFVTVAINTFYGVRAVDRNLLDVSRVFGASGRKRVLSIVVPSTTPFVLVGMRVGVARAVGAVMLGEFMTSEAGIGNFIFRSAHSLQADKVLFGAGFVALFALSCFLILGALERRFSRWRPRVGSA